MAIIPANGVIFGRASGIEVQHLTSPTVCPRSVEGFEVQRGQGLSSAVYALAQR